MTTDRTLSSLGELAAQNLIEPSTVPALQPVADRYAIAVSPEMATLIDQSDDPADPIARQFLPTTQELHTHPREMADPIGDDAHAPLPGLVHRYPDRVLLKPVAVCPVYCRFCFRREAVGPQNGESLRDADLRAAFAYIRERSEIWEVIVTGGDPLVLSPRRIREIGDTLSAIPHVRVIRWHTRVPVVRPSLITPDVAGALASPIAHGRMVYVSIHTNHARELTRAADNAIAQLRQSGPVLISQTVLLRGINDSVEALTDLLRGLVQRGVTPYYLHQLDRAPGTAQFHVPLEQARELVQRLRGHLSGLCQPTFIIDIPGGYGKVPADSAIIEPTPRGHRQDSTAREFTIRDRNGVRHRYYD